MRIEVSMIMEWKMREEECLPICAKSIKSQIQFGCFFENNSLNDSSLLSSDNLCRALNGISEGRSMEMRVTESAC